MKIKKCPTCGITAKAHTHALTPGLIKVLIKMIVAVKKKNKNAIHLQIDMNLTNNEYNNFQKLRYHALVAKTDVRGVWLITRRGGQFLRGDVSVPRTVTTFLNKVESHSEERMHIRDLRNKVSWFQKDFETQLRSIAEVKEKQQRLFSYDRGFKVDSIPSSQA